MIPAVCGGGRKAKATSSARLIARTARFKAALWTRSPVRTLRRVASGVRHTERVLLVSEYERPTDKRPVVLFQVAGWGPGSTGSPEVAAAVEARIGEMLEKSGEA